MPGSVTPLQMASAYGVFANGGYRVNPVLIAKVTDSKGRVLSQGAKAAAALGRIDARHRRAQRLRDDQPAAGGDALGHRRIGKEAR